MENQADRRGFERDQASRAGAEQAQALTDSLPIEAQFPEVVAGAILDLIRNGDQRADLVPAQFGGTVAA